MKRIILISTCAVMFLTGLAFAFSMEDAQGHFHVANFIFAAVFLFSALYIQVKYVINEKED